MEDKSESCLRLAKEKKKPGSVQSSKNKSLDSIVRTQHPQCKVLSPQISVWCLRKNSRKAVEPACENFPVIQHLPPPRLRSEKLVIERYTAGLL